MPRRVVLMRHATAEPRARSDAERPLAPLGHEEARRMGEALAARGVRAARVVASPARRTVETAAHVARAMGAPEPTFDARIWEADVEDLLRVVAEVACPGATVVVVGHNPGMANAVVALSGAPLAWDGMGAFFPPASAAVIDLPDEAEVREGSGERMWLLRPRET